MTIAELPKQMQQCKAGDVNNEAVSILVQLEYSQNEARLALDQQFVRQDLLIRTLIESLGSGTQTTAASEACTPEGSKGSVIVPGTAPTSPREPKALQSVQSSGSLDSMGDEDALRATQSNGKLNSDRIGRYTRNRILDARKKTSQNDILGDGCMGRLATRISAWGKMLEEPPRKGRLARFLSSTVFEVMSATVILATSLVTIITANYKAQHLTNEPPGIWLAGIVLLMIYMLEVSMKLYVHRWYFFVNEDWCWNCFDVFLVGSELWTQIFRVVVENGSGMRVSFLRSLRILKVTRVLRLIRVVSIFRELRLLLEAMLGSISTVFWCGVTMTFTLMISALVFVQFITDFMIDNPEEELNEKLSASFGTVQRATVTLFMSTSGGVDWGPIYDDFRRVGDMASGTYLLFLFFFQFGMFNLLTSMFVDRAMKASKPDTDALVLEQRKVQEEQKLALSIHFSKFDSDGDGRISWDEFYEMISDERAVLFFQTLGLQIIDAEMFFQVLADITHSDEVPIDMFVQGCMRMKGTATSIDVQALQLAMHLLLEKVDGLDDSMREVRSRQQSLPATFLPDHFKL